MMYFTRQMLILIINLSFKHLKHHIIMKKLFFVFFLTLPFLLTAQEGAPANNMYEALMITPQKNKIMEFRANINAHNEKYHNEGAYSVNMYQIIGGPNNGKVMWIMGPCNFGHLDNMPGGDVHNDDWVKNVMPLTEDITHKGFWNLNIPLSYGPENTVFKKFRVRFLHIKSGEAYRFNKMMENLQKVSVEKKYKTSRFVYYPRLASSDGPNAAVMFGHNNWAELDEAGPGKDYDSVHGEGSWENFLKEAEEAVEGMDDELWEWVSGTLANAAGDN
jgi:hypothetical protein